MKKLMFSAVAVAAMASFGIESDIVGYQNKDLQMGFTMTAATFVPITSESVSINDIKPTGSSVDEGTVNIQTLNAFGVTTATYTYMGADMFDDGYPAGWYDVDGVADVSFPVGTGLWVAGPDADTGLTFSGKVGTADVKVVLRTGFTATANMMPTDVDIQDIVAEGPAVDEGTVNIQTLNAYGVTSATYTYMGTDMFDDGYPAGWYDVDGLAVKTFTAGEGLWVAGPDTDTSITIPAPEL